MWPVVSPSSIPFAKGYPMPKEMTQEELDRVDEAFRIATERCKQIGCTQMSLTVQNFTHFPQSIS
jgi:2,4-dienoyl-CoA reductase-like NADH-dependent reductase (Old Yellow Enzyme family)